MMGPEYQRAWQQYKCDGGHLFMSPPADWAPCTIKLPTGGACGMRGVPYP